MHIFYLFFVQFMQLPVLDFGLDHFGSWPFNYYNLQIIHPQIFNATMSPK